MNRDSAGRDTILSTRIHGVGNQSKRLLFWTEVQSNYQTAAILLFFLGIIIPVFICDRLDGYILWGSVIGALSLIGVIVSYLQVPSWRRHPSPLIFNKSLVDFCFSVVVILNTFRIGEDGDKDESCRTIGALTQFLLITAECWTLTLPMDLSSSISNPFASYKQNLFLYHILIWSFGLAHALVLAYTPGCYGEFAVGICWMSISSPLCPCFWSFYFGWVILFYVYSLFAIGQGVGRMSKKNTISIPETFEKRRACVQHTIFASGTYFLYLSFLGILYFVSMAVDGDNVVEDDSEKTNGKNMISKLLGYSFAARGILDAIVWFHLTSTSTFSSSSLSSSSPPSSSSRTTQSPSSYTTGFDSTTSTLSGLGSKSMSSSDLQPFDDLDLDLSPQLNLALRHEIVHFVTMGIREAVSHTYDDFSNNHRVYNLTKEGLKPILDSKGRAKKKKNKNKNKKGYNSSEKRFWKASSFQESKKKHTHDIEEGDGDDDDDDDEEDQEQEEEKETKEKEQKDVEVDTLLSPSSSSSMTQRLLNHHEESEQKMNHSSSSSSSVYEHKTVEAYHSPPSYLDFEKRKQAATVSLSHSLYGCLEFIFSYLFPNTGQYQNVLFEDFYPHIFHQLRELIGLKDCDYLKMLSSACREQISEGGSGSFMFESANRYLLVKTISKEEAEVLQDILIGYHTYLTHNPQSFLVRFLGLHSLTLYSHTFHFVVMKSVFPIDKPIHLRYDIKGSWVSRDAKRPQPYQKVFCRHCGEMFVYGDENKNPSCVESIGKCEPNMVLKDNDLTQKLKLVPDHNYMVLSSINKDVDFLASLGICDYSLLIGVQNYQFMVEASNFDQRDASSEMLARFCKKNINRRIPHFLPRGTASFSSPSTRKSYQESQFDETLDLDLDGEEEDDDDDDEEENGFDILHGTIPTKLEDLEDSDDNNNNDDGFLETDGSMYEAPMSFKEESNWLQSEIGHTVFPSRSVIGPGTYSFGIIDILTRWSFKKELERFFKVNIARKDERGLSCVPPLPYKKRFQKKMDSIFDHEHFIREITGSWKQTERFLSSPKSLLGRDSLNNEKTRKSSSRRYSTPIMPSPNLKTATDSTKTSSIGTTNGIQDTIIEGSEEHEV